MIHKGLITTVKDVDQKGRIIVAANALGNIDAHNDISLEGSFRKTLSENFSRVRWFLNHNPNILLGVPIQGQEKFPYLEMEGQLNMQKQVSRDTYEDYKLYAEYQKSLEHSIGVSAVKFQDENGVRKVSEWKLWEYSTLTSWGANENTPLLGLKNLDADWLNIMLQKGNYTEERYKEIEKQLNILKTLVNEPQQSTHEKPKENVDLLSAIKLFNLLN
jgi:hypothetical protein